MLELRGGEKMAWSEAAYSTKRNVAEAMSDLTAVMLGMAQQNVTAAQSTINDHDAPRPDSGLPEILMHTLPPDGHRSSWGGDE